MAIPSHGQLALPLLSVLSEFGGMARPGEIYDRLAEVLHLDDEDRDRVVTCGTGRQTNEFERRVRWVRQSAVLKGLVDGSQYGRWALTDRANAKLQNIVRGKIITAFETEHGVLLWASAEDACGVIERGSVQLIFSSPPYPILREKAYGGMDSRTWHSWMLRLCEAWRPLLTPDGSLMLNLGTVWNQGVPTQDLYVEKLLIALTETEGWHLAQRFDWHSPTKLPMPLEWCGIRRIRVKPSVEPVLWLAPSPWPKADNRNVLKEYAKSSLRAIANPADGVHRRPSGHVFGPNSFVDRGGAIPPSLLVASNCSSNDAYHRAERAAGRDAHPAPCPESIIEFGVKLTTDVGDTAYDPFGGSCTLANVCERLGRKHITSERSRYYLEGGRLRLEASGVPVRAVA